MAYKGMMLQCHVCKRLVEVLASTYTQADPEYVCDECTHDATGENVPCAGEERP